MDKTSAIDTVVKSDKRRLELIKEEAELTKKLESGDMNAGERLKEVCLNFVGFFLTEILFEFIHQSVW